MAKPNTSPLSGTRDFLPVDVLRRRYVVSVVEEVYQSFGFEPLETPVMERLDTLLGKYGEEGDQLIFRVMKRGEKLARALTGEPSENDLADSGLRYDLTVPLARVAAEYQDRFPRVFKRYQIQPVFRADRPAKGRFREFYQCDLDIVGSTSQVVEAEVLEAAAEVLLRLGFGSDDFVIRLNHRQVLRGLMASAGVDSAHEESALVAIDKLDKVGAAGVRQELQDRSVDLPVIDQLMRVIDRQPGDKSAPVPSWLEAQIQGSEPAAQGLRELLRILELTRSGVSGSHLVVDPFLARGLSYYTGPIFEVSFEGFAGSAGGGGRYDNLIGMFSNRPIPACGFSLGLERILLILEERGLFPERMAGQPEVVVTLFGDETTEESLKVARVLRSQGLRVDVFPEAGKYPRQFKYAEQRGIRYAVLLGPREMEAGVVTIRDLKMGEQVDLRVKEAAAWLRRR
jgi:histidyl-tRNA synthetase